MALNDDGSVLATTTVNPDGVGGSLIQLWDVGTLTPIGPPLHSYEWQRVTALEFSDDPSESVDLIAAGLEGGAINLWDVSDPAAPEAWVSQSGAPLSAPGTEDGSYILDLDVVPYGTLAAGASDGTIRLWDLSLSGQPSGDPLTGHTSFVTSVVLPSFNTVVSAGDDGTIRIWNTNTGAQINVLQPGGRAVAALNDPSPNDAATVASVAGGLLHLWDLATGDPLTSSPLSDTTTDAVEFAYTDPDDLNTVVLATLDTDTGVDLWSLNRG